MRDAEGAAESPQRGALLAGPQHLGLALPAVAQHLAGPALTALLLLAPAAVVPVPDEVRTAALAAVMNLAGLDHRYPPLQG